MNDYNKAFEELVTIMKELREKCPWDKKQTIESLRPLTIEETYELAEAIINKDYTNLKEELGDVLLHIVFYATIGEEQQQFTLADIITTLNEKLIRRHPHIYSNVEVKDEEEVKRNWEQIKLTEKNKPTGLLQGVPKGLPAIIKATRMQEKAKQVGFEWDNATQVWDKVKEEMNELTEAVTSQNSDHIEEEFGDVLFSLINYARFLNIDAEAALEKTNQKFLQRFNKMEAMANNNGTPLQTLNLQQMDDIWNIIKKQQC